MVGHQNTPSICCKKFASAWLSFSVSVSVTIIVSLHTLRYRWQWRSQTALESVQKKKNAVAISWLSRSGSSVRRAAKNKTRRPAVSPRILALSPNIFSSSSPPGRNVPLKVRPLVRMYTVITVCFGAVLAGVAKLASRVIADVVDPERFTDHWSAHPPRSSDSHWKWRWTRKICCIPPSLIITCHRFVIRSLPIAHCIKLQVQMSSYCWQTAASCLACRLAKVHYSTHRVCVNLTKKFLEIHRRFCSGHHGCRRNAMPIRDRLRRDGTSRWWTTVVVNGVNWMAAFLVLHFLMSIVPLSRWMLNLYFFFIFFF